MVGCNMLGVMPILTMVSRYMMLILLPLSIKTRVNLTLTAGPVGDVIPGTPELDIYWSCR